jgi:hypothetical protein
MRSGNPATQEPRRTAGRLTKACNYTLTLWTQLSRFLYHFEPELTKLARTVKALEDDRQRLHETAGQLAGTVKALEDKLRQSEASRKYAWQQLQNIRGALEILFEQQIKKPTVPSFQEEGNLLVSTLVKEVKSLTTDISILESAIRGFRPLMRNTRPAVTVARLTPPRSGLPFRLSRRDLAANLRWICRNRLIVYQSSGPAVRHLAQSGVYIYRAIHYQVLHSSPSSLASNRSSAIIATVPSI